MFQFPVSFSGFGYTITLHAILEFLAYFIGFRLYLYLRNKKGDTINDNNRIWIIIGAIGGALVGSRLVGVFESWQALKSTPNLLLFILGNKSMVGGLLGGLWGVEFTKYLIGEKKKSGDLFVFPILIALIIGRIGCFSMGIYEDVVGYPTTSFTGMDLGDGIPRHPLMMYEIVFLTALLVTIKYLQSTITFTEGGLFKLFMMAYLAFRFGIEFLKPHEGYIFGFGAIQLACLSGLTYYFRYIIKPILLVNKMELNPDFTSNKI